MWFYKEGKNITLRSQKEMMKTLIITAKKKLNKNKINHCLLLPPDITRFQSGAGILTNYLYHFIKKQGGKVDIIPTLGQHQIHTTYENKKMFGDIPQKKFYNHHWLKDCQLIGKIDRKEVFKYTEKKANWDIPLEINQKIFEKKYDFIINIGRVVPHEILGMANHNKNYFIGLGGKNTLNTSQLMGACYGLEDNLGQIISPLRGFFNQAEKKYLSHLPQVYVLIVKTPDKKDKLITSGLYVGSHLNTYLQAAKYAQKKTIRLFKKPLQKIICYMEKEFESTWVSNKAIYRTRKSIKKGGELIIIAPGVKRFGEQKIVDQLINKYGYFGTKKTLKAYKKNKDLNQFSNTAAHLIHGSSEGRFKITYAPASLSKKEIEKVGYHYMDIKKALAIYSPQEKKEGYYKDNTNSYYFIKYPSAGLWSSQKNFIKSLKINQKYIKKMIKEEEEENSWNKIYHHNLKIIKKIKKKK